MSAGENEFLFEYQLVNIMADSKINTWSLLFYGFQIFSKYCLLSSKNKWKIWKRCIRWKGWKDQKGMEINRGGGWTEGNDFRVV